ncbi:hypothetical protein GCM10011611_07660 [Aliidongia dinghuensis]|uniref:Uncharacterized protein n=1 Tax=Aliidongia dinghuensis TaxID=1867774 RepID=A0A8J3E388_9PROT|nr:AraC family transcriptional regulator [Aliidongia dinghuensis]GGF04728.1 hypothetical protein GCM10011611_07660 [Aliidongia dinghuensis]
MGPTGAYGHRLGRYFGLDAAPSLVTSGPRRRRFAVTRLCCGRDQLGLKQTIPAEDAFIVILHLAAIGHLELWRHGHPVSAGTYAPGSISIANLMDDFAVSIGGPLDCLSFYMPRPLFDALADEAGAPRLEALQCAPGHEDPIIEQIGAALLPLLASPETVAPGFLEHIALATTVHVAHTYGNLRLDAYAPFLRWDRKLH